jgi:NADPH2:quinone reductase
MNAAVLHASGTVPRFGQFPDPLIQENNDVIVRVRAAALKPVDKQMADGSHYSAFREFPVVCGVDGVGVLEGGGRVFFAAPRLPHGAMAEQTVVEKSHCFPLPDSVDDITAAAVFNPGLSAWGALKWRAQLTAGESVLILGATGVTGQLAIQTAKFLGATRVLAAGRNPEILKTLPTLGADAVIPIGEPGQNLAEDFAHVMGDTAVDIVIDYLWGAPAEALLAALTRYGFQTASRRVRWIQVGESAAATISLPAAVLRSSRLEILGSGSGSAPTKPELWVEAIQQLLSNVAHGKLKVETEQAPLSDVEKTWNRAFPGHRVVFIP